MGEVIARGEQGTTTNYNMFVQWAYLNYAPIDGMSIKLGRQRYAIWTASEYVNAHYELPYKIFHKLCTMSLLLSHLMALRYPIRLKREQENYWLKSLEVLPY